jgi:hypothetical protein
MIQLLFLMALATAQEHEKSPFEQMLESNGAQETKERWIQAGGTQYREIEFRGNKYYIKLTGEGGQFAQLDCEVPGKTPNTFEAGFEVYKRTYAFVSFLRNTCEKIGGQYQRRVDFNAFEMGLRFPNGKNDKITNKRVIIDPRHPVGLGFKGDF